MRRNNRSASDLEPRLKEQDSCLPDGWPYGVPLLIPIHLHCAPQAERARQELQEQGDGWSGRAVHHAFKARTPGCSVGPAAFGAWHP